MRNYTITRIWGIPIRLNVSLVVFLPLLAWLIGSGGQISIYASLIERYMGVAFDIETLRAGSMPWVIGIIAAIGLFISVTLHELGHSWVALRYGLEIESITLWILGGMASLASIPREWNREFWIAIAGPVTSVGVGAVCYVGLLAVPPGLPVVRFLFGWLAVTNVLLAAFNLLPAFPMDGGRILRALLARNRPYASATRIAGRIGVVFALLFAVVGALSFNVILLLLALFIYGAATSESRTVVIDELLDGITVGDVMTHDPPSVDAAATVGEFADRMLRERQTTYLVTDDSGGVVGVATLEGLKGVSKADRDSVTVGSIAQELPRVDATADAFDTMAASAGRSGPYALVEVEGVVAGLLSDSDYAHALTIQRGFQSSITG
jgi:Zn-dependent protease